MKQDFKRGKIGHYAFTLAEVLITLGIIGIVAAMTLPTLIQNQQKKVTTTGLKKAYAIMSQAVMSSTEENGSTEYWDYNLSSKEFYERYLANYLKKTEEVPMSKIKERVTYKYINGDTDAGGLNNPNSFASKLSDGTFIVVDNWTNGLYRNIIVDLNGFAKPNQTGKDVFWFQIYPKLGFMPNSYNAPLDNPSEHGACNKQKTGYFCTAKIMQDGWEIKDDYPW